MRQLCVLIVMPLDHNTQTKETLVLIHVRKNKYINKVKYYETAYRNMIEYEN